MVGDDRYDARGEKPEDFCLSRPGSVAQRDSTSKLLVSIRVSKTKNLILKGSDGLRFPFSLYTNDNLFKGNIFSGIRYSLLYRLDQTGATWNFHD